MFVMSFGLVAYVGVAGFLLIYLVIKRPPFLFNPSDYDSSVQHLLFSNAPQLVVKTPPQADDVGDGRAPLVEQPSQQIDGREPG